MTIAPCSFCPQPTASTWAVTYLTCEGIWHRAIDAICPRCESLIRHAGAGGRRIKATGDRIWLGHNTGGPYPARQFAQN